MGDVLHCAEERLDAAGEFGDLFGIVGHSIEELFFRHQLLHDEMHGRRGAVREGHGNARIADGFPQRPITLQPGFDIQVREDMVQDVEVARLANGAPRDPGLRGSGIQHLFGVD